MYEVTAAEASTILSVLSRSACLVGSDADLHGMPSSTYYAARRKIYASGWLADRFVPNPWASGVASVNFVVASPGPTERARVENQMAADPSTVVLWSGLNALFAVSFTRQADAPSKPGRTVVSVSSSAGSIPVYFDFSRAWSRFIQVERETGYPRALGLATTASERGPIAGLREAVTGVGPDQGQNLRAHPWHSSVELPRSLQRLLEKGLIESRTLLNLDILPPYDNRVLSEFVFLGGEMREGVSPLQVLGTLHNECKVSPILLAEDGERLLIVALGQLASGNARRTKIPRASAHVSRALDGAVKDLSMLVERADSMRVVVNHRYDRPLTAELG